MPSESRASRRLHPVSPLFRVGSAARALLLPGLAVLLLSRGGNYEIWLMLLFVPTVVGTLAQYWSYHYRFADEELVVSEGIVQRNERHIPYSRIQNIDLVQNPLHRIFRVAEVRIETAAGQKPEATMRVLALDAVEDMRERVFAGRRSTETTEARTEVAHEKARQIHSLGLADVLLFGFISNRGMVFVAAALGLVWQTNSWERVWQAAGRDDVESVVNIVRDQGAIAVVAAVLAALAVFVIAVRLLSLVWALVKFHGFRLTRRRETLRAEYGLVTRVTKSMPRRRVQVLSTREGPLHRLAGRISVQVQTAGGGEGEGNAETGKLWLAPLVARRELDRLVGEALPGVSLEQADWQPISRRALWRLTRLLIAFALPAVAAAAQFGGFWPFAIATAVALSLALQIRLYVRYAGWALLPDAVAWRSGWWTRRISVARFAKVQAVRLVASPFDRRNRMASVHVDTAGASKLGHGVEMLYLDVDVAGSVTERLAHAAAGAEFQW